ncbi:aspartate kinase [Meredithblackwellia eburnea MCA 4105]
MSLRKNGNGQVVVQKYGGTSVGKFLKVIGQEIIPSYLDENNKVVIVCSARSGESKSTGTTNLLLRAASEALRPSNSTPSTSIPGTPTAPKSPAPSSKSSLNPLLRRSSSLSRSASGSATPAGALSASIASLRMSAAAATSSSAALRLEEEAASQAFNATVDQIKQDHLVAARANVKDEDILRELEDDLEYDCERLRSFLLAAQIIDEISARSKDIIMGVGERLSCRIVTASLRDQGIDAELVSLENIVEAAGVDEDGTAAATADSGNSLGQTFYDRLSKRLGERLLECGDRVPVVTGFFGVVPGSLLAQVGRGYTDLCAALCAVGLSAAELQIWKEVDGIFTADPRKVPTSRLLATITPEEAAELTYYGSEVIHPFTMEQAIRCSVPIRIKNVENPTGQGTIIFPDPPSQHGSADEDEEPPATMTASLALAARRGPTAVTIKDNILILSIRSNRKTISHGFFASIFGTLDRYGIVVDLISTSEVYVSMAINGSIRPHVLERIKRDLKLVGEVQIKADMAILSLVGKHMRNMVGIAGKMFRFVGTLAEGNINIEMISQGASEINISCVIDVNDAVKALNVVHHKLLSAKVQAATGAGPWLY